MKKHLVSPLSVFTLFAATAAAGLAADAPATWGQNCAACHGADGAGHTRAGKMLGSKDLTDPAYQKSFTDDQATSTIKDGFKDSSGKVKMKAFAGLSDADVKALVAYVRTLAK